MESATRTPSDPSRLLRSLWLWAALALANCILLFIQWWIGEWLHHSNGSVYPHDYISQWAAGHRVLEGHAQRVYDWRDQVAFETKLISAPRPVKVYFLYPPPFLFTTIVFARLNLVAAYLCFLGVTGAIYTLALRMITKSWLKAACVSVAGGGAYVTLLWVQNGLLTSAIFTAALVFLPKRPLVSGVLLGAMSLKPQLGLLIPFALIAGRNWPALLMAIATFLILAALSAVMFGIAIWPAFFQSLAQSRQFLEGGSLWFKMQSPFALSLPLLGRNAAYGVQAIIFALVLWVVVDIWREPTVPAAYKSSAVLSGSLLVSPYVFSYDATVLSAAVLMLTCENKDITALEATLLILALLLPGFTETLHSAATPIASLIILLLSLRFGRTHKEKAGIPNGRTVFQDMRTTSSC